MAFTSRVDLATIDLGPDFEFFGPGTTLHVTVTASLGMADYLTHGPGPDWISASLPVAAEWDKDVQVPVVDQSGWEDQDGIPVSGWSYVVEVVATASGRAPVFWVGSASPASTQPRVTLEASAGTITGRVSISDPALVNPNTGGLMFSGGDPIAVSLDPDVSGAYLIGE